MRHMIFAVSMMLAAPAMAQEVTKTSPLSVNDTVNGLVTAVEAAGATVFARVNHAAGAESVGKAIPDAQLLIFGNPALGTLAMEMDLRAGLVLPLRVLVYEDVDGATQMTWTAAEGLFDGLNIPADAEVVSRINGAMNGLTDKAMSLN